jgi:hypothetical protein
MQRTIPITGILLIAALGVLPACSKQTQTPVLHWHVFDEQSGAFAHAAQDCSAGAQRRYRIELTPLPTNADQQREQLVRRLAEDLEMENGKDAHRQLVARVDPALGIEEGQTLQLTLPRHHLVLFDAASGKNISL